ncbi:ABC transporter substrate-binding protein [Microbacterium sp.]|uniref:ABC transporter substrate-binding protein n=1 Tax=Microbacterium sp. TaxID=51671 RepID=UPI003F9D26B3
MQRRTIATVAALGTASLVLAGCGGESGASSDDAWALPDEDPKATIQVLGHQAEDTGILEVIDAFESAHPNISVEYEGVPFDQLNSILDARIGNKDGNPDVFWADQPRIATLASRGYTESLTEQFEGQLGTLDDAPIESSSFDGELWALPIANSTQLMYYNKALLDQAGLEYPSASPEDRMTWEDLTEDATTAVAAGSKYGLLFGQPDRYYQLEPLAVSLGGSAGATGDDNLTPDLMSDAWTDALAWYGSIHAQGLSPKGVNGEQSSEEFLAGNVAYFVQGPWLVPDLADDEIDWGVAPQPYFEGGDAVTPTGSWSLAMSPFSDDKEAAAVFMKWMSIDDGGGYALHLPAPELPASAEGKTAYYERDIFSSPAGQDATAIIDFETKNTAVPRLATIGYVEFEEILGRAYSDVKNGTDPAKALETATTELETAWAKYK